MVLTDRQSSPCRYFRRYIDGIKSSLLFFWEQKINIWEFNSLHVYNGSFSRVGIVKACKNILSGSRFQKLYKKNAIFSWHYLSLKVWFLPRCMECRRGLAMRFLSVRLSVRPSVCQTRVLWQNGRKICPDFYTMRKIIQSSFMRRRMVGGGDPFYLKFWVKRPALERNRRFWTNNRS